MKYKVGDVIIWLDQAAAAQAIITQIRDGHYFYTFLEGIFVEPGERWNCEFHEVEIRTRLNVDVAKIWREVLNDP